MERGGELLGGFLPPEPSGPEPDLAAPGHRPQQDAPDDHGFLPPQQAAAHGYAPPPQPSQPPSADAVLGPAGTVPDNGDALAGLILSASAAGLLLLSVGMSSIISVVCAGLGIYYSRKGRARVDRGETPKHRGVAQAGFVTGIVALVLSVLMTIIWVTFAILYATDESFRQELEDRLEGDESSPDGFETAVPLGITALRGVALLLR
ncbi:MAG: hypothetical protein M3131_01405 [Actinomycetota bacterium]|nr:hypothetical protein [Actinomycetota bacterium]